MSALAYANGEHAHRKTCSCGQPAVANGECASCAAKRAVVQRSAVSPAPLRAVPAVVGEVIATPGQPLDSATRSAMESRFGADFSRVRVHTDARAARSARAIDANAYTVGSAIAFDQGRYDVGSVAGRRLLAHELAHVVQQSATGGTSNSRQAEADADRAANSAAAGLQAETRVAAATGLQRQEASTTEKPSGAVGLTPEQLENLRRTDPSLAIITWTPDFLNGLQRSGLDAKLGEIWDSLKTNISSPLGYAAFSAGMVLGIPAGALADLAHQAKGLLVLGYQLARIFVLAHVDPRKLRAELEEFGKGIKDLVLQLLDAELVGFELGVALGDQLKKELKKGPFAQGFTIGTYLGALVMEIALLFVGVEEATAIARSARVLSRTRFGKVVLEAMAKSPEVRAFLKSRGVLTEAKAEAIAKGAEAAKGALKTGEEAKAAGSVAKTAEEAKAARGAEGKVPSAEAEEAATLERSAEKAGGLTTAEIDAELGFVERGESQASTDPDYVREVALPPNGKHKWRQHQDGWWCRFSTKGVCVPKQAVKRKQPQPGRWLYDFEGGTNMSAEAAEYQVRVCNGKPRKGYYVGPQGVQFDGVDKGGRLLLEAKHYTSGSRMARELAEENPYVGEALLAQARRQLGAAGTTPVEWRVASPEATAKIRELFQTNNINIKVVYRK